MILGPVDSLSRPYKLGRPLLSWLYMVVVLNSFVSKRPFFANKKVTFANLSRIHRRALFLAPARKSLILSASVVREIRFPNSRCKVATFITGVVHDMHGLERRSFSQAVQLQLKVATFQYQAGILTSAALRKYLPLTIEAAFAELSRIFHGTFAKNHPRFRAERRRVNTHRHTYTGVGH